MSGWYSSILGILLHVAMVGEFPSSVTETQSWAGGWAAPGVAYVTRARSVEQQRDTLDVALMLSGRGHKSRGSGALSPNEDVLVTLKPTNKNLSRISRQ